MSAKKIDWTYRVMRGLLTGGLTLCAGLAVVSCASAPEATGESVEAEDPGVCGADDSVYVGDRGAPDDVARFDPDTGASLGVFVATTSGGLDGPSALLFVKREGHHELLVVNQDLSSQTLTGGVLRYNAKDGSFLGALVAATDADVNPTPPFAPRGMVLGDDHVLYIADQGGTTNGGTTLPPRIARFSEHTGAFLGDLDLAGFPFVPRDLVIGPDGQLYVGAVPPAGAAGGQIARFDRVSGTLTNVVYDATDPSSLLNRPTGLGFGPDGRLYAMSNRRGLTDADRIVILEVHHGRGYLVDHIDLDVAGGTPHAGSELIFGPEGGLFVTFNVTGELRRYDALDHDFVELVPENGALAKPGYLVFRASNPGTLAYEPCETHD